MKLYTLTIFLGFCLNTISSFYVKKKAEKLLNEPYKPLPDILHSILPKINTLIPDYFLFLSICLIFISNKLNNLEDNLLFGIMFNIKVIYCIYNNYAYLYAQTRYK